MEWKKEKEKIKLRRNIKVDLFDMLKTRSPHIKFDKNKTLNNETITLMRILGTQEVKKKILFDKTLLNPQGEQFITQ